MSERFGTISSIDVGLEQSWRDRFFLTLNIDWARDDMLTNSIKLVTDAAVFATCSVTHKTSLLEYVQAQTLPVQVAEIVQGYISFACGSGKP
ncbi:hypothetical protein PGN35_023110 [Nodosilinea sp. PGN35]|uniref:polysaccharide deacetylase WbmS family protein n=1 Tax=Nodosilinea sp. PGN35 TaxID=3020489 RepID=UPI0023B22509|nr:hypothetical protein [Nodosilinea sp. TSF1-S3]MDF0364661.1 hypothetical protein [Nodosilinea sp. TSF1-S3]